MTGKAGYLGAFLGLALIVFGFTFVGVCSGIDLCAADSPNAWIAGVLISIFGMFAFFVSLGIIKR